jgi:hypothetical protein
MTISTRYMSNLALILGASFLVVATQVFVPDTVVWLTFAISLGVLLVSMGLIFAPKMGIHQRVVGGVIAALAAWMIVASLVFAPATVLWLGFGIALAYVGAGVLGLTIHELTTERVVHSLEIERLPAETVSRERIAA